MFISTQTWSNWILLHIRGDFLLRNLNTVRSRFEEAIALPTPHLALDLSEMRLIDSSGISFIIHLHKKISANGGALAIVSDNQEIRLIFTVSGIEKLVQLFDSLNAFYACFATEGAKRDK
jgi:stage II sporulation protein AA (anti-sigma F factor antagonist)